MGATEEGTARHNRKAWTQQASKDSWTAGCVDGVVVKRFNENIKIEMQMTNITIRNALAVAAIERTTSVTILRKRALVLVLLLTNDEEVEPTTLLHPNCGQSSKTHAR